MHCNPAVPYERRYIEAAHGHQLMIDVSQLYSVCINIIRRNLSEADMTLVATRLVDMLPAVCGVLSQQREIPMDDFALHMLIGFHTLPADAVANLVEVFRTCFLPSTLPSRPGELSLFSALLQVSSSCLWCSCCAVCSPNRC